MTADETSVDSVIILLSEIEPTETDYKPIDVEKARRELTQSLERLDGIRFFLITADVDNERRHTLSVLIDKKYGQVLDILTLLAPVN